jgi:hypothetical protein
MTAAQINSDSFSDVIRDTLCSLGYSLDGTCQIWGPIERLQCDLDGEPVQCYIDVAIHHSEAKTWWLMRWIMREKNGAKLLPPSIVSQVSQTSAEHWLFHNFAEEGVARVTTRLPR